MLHDSLPVPLLLLRWHQLLAKGTLGRAAATETKGVGEQAYRHMDRPVFCAPNPEFCAALTSRSWLVVGFGDIASMAFGTKVLEPCHAVSHASAQNREYMHPLSSERLEEVVDKANSLNTNEDIMAFLPLVRALNQPEAGKRQ